MDKLKLFIQTNPVESDCVHFLEKLYWDGKPFSPFDESSKVYKCKNGYKCKSTGKYFNVRIGTLFAETKTPLIYWLRAIVILERGKISSYKLAAELGIGQKSAWFILHKIKIDYVKYVHFIYLLL